jgi:hypothetical protein
MARFNTPKTFPPFELLERVAKEKTALFYDYKTHEWLLECDDPGFRQFPSPATR